MIKHVHRGIKQIIAAIALLSAEIILLLAIFSAALIAFIAIARMVFKEKKTDFDQDAFNFLANHVSSVNTHVMEAFTFLGTHTFLIPANLLLVAFFLFIKKHKWYSITVPAVALSGLMLMFFLKFIFQRSRPLIPLLSAAEGYSFPSGHATMATTFYGLIIFLTWRNIKRTGVKWILTCSLIFLIIAIGTSRVYLRVHYASDVLAGFSVGLMWLLFSLWVLNKIEVYSRKKVEPLVEPSG